MKKLLSLSLFIIISCLTATAQRSLTIKDVSSDLAVFSGQDTEAGITVSCPANMELSFESTHDKEVDIFKTELKGEEMFYYLRFETGKRYRGRKITIRSEGFNSVFIMTDLKPKELKTYQLIDPDAEFVFGCYYEYRKRGNDFFQKSMYNEAKENYLIAQEASDRPADSNLEELIAKVDSISVYMQKGEKAASLLDYNTAISHYTNILALNPLDENARNIRNEYVNKVKVEHKQYYDMAELYKNNGEYEKALEMYERVVNSKVYNSYYQNATEEAKEMRMRISNRKMRARVFLYEYSMETPIGISSGKYKNRRGGNYFNLSVNADVFKLINKKDTDLYAELSFTPLGWNFNLVPNFPHFWLFFGFGYTGAAQYVNEAAEDSSGTGDDIIGDIIDGVTDSILGTGDGPKFKMAHAVSPEVGMLFKVWRVALKYTFQYRYTLYSDIPTEIKPHRHSIGVGITF